MRFFVVEYLGDSFADADLDRAFDMAGLEADGGEIQVYSVVASDAYAARLGDGHQLAAWHGILPEEDNAVEMGLSECDPIEPQHVLWSREPPWC